MYLTPEQAARKTLSMKGNCKHFVSDLFSCIGIFIGQTHESVGRDGDLAQLAQPLLSLLGGEGSGDLVELVLVVLLLLAAGGNDTTAEHVDGVGLVGALGSLLPLDVKSTLVEAHEPVVGLVTCKTSAVDAGLLTSTETDDLAVQSVADRVGLGVLEGNGCDGHVTESRLGKWWRVLGGDDGAEGASRSDLGIVAVLGEVDAVDGTHLLGGGLVLGVHLEHKVLATLLLAEDLKSLLGVRRGNDTVRNLTGDDLGSGHIDLGREGNHVTEAGHTVGTTGSGVGLGKTGRLNTLDVVNHVDLALDGVEWHTNSSTGRGDVLERGGSREVQGLAELLDQRPCVEGIKKVDEARGSAKNLEWHLLVLHECSSGLLVGVGTVAEGNVLDTVAGVLLAEEVRDGSIVVCSMLECLQCVQLPGGVTDLTLLELQQEVVVGVGVAQDGDSGVVLCGSTNQGDSTNVNLFNSLGDGDIDLGDSVLEGVQVADDIVNLVDVLLGEVLLIRGEVTSKNTSVNRRVECLDTATEHLRCFGDCRHISEGTRSVS